MKSGFAVFFAVCIALGGSWFGFVLAPELQLGMAKQTTILNSTDNYPLQRTGEATLGLQVYRAYGCAACHTEQLRQDGIVCDVVVTGLGKNPVGTAAAIWRIETNWLGRATETPPTVLTPPPLPRKVLRGVDKLTADAAAEKISTAGGKVEIVIAGTGSDLTRGWGVRRSVAADFL